MPKSQDQQPLWKGSEDSAENQYDHLNYDSTGTGGGSDAVVFSPRADEVAFSALHNDDDSVGDGETRYPRRVPFWASRGWSTSDKRTKWIAIVIIVVVVCLLIAILGSVFIVTGRSSSSEAGQHQAVVADTCTRVPCRNGATCVDGTEIFNCLCAPGFTGILCETNINECESSPCMDGTARCLDHINGYSCQCHDGFTGIHCETDINDCEQTVCADGASTCVDGINSFTCVCHSGYTGTYCEENIDECASSPCGSASTCYDGIDSFECLCADGYSGDFCHDERDECISSPCANGATCHDELNGYRCQCQLGYTGVHCEFDFDECSSNPCSNGATCHDAINEYYCQCDNGFTGSFCETDYDECLSLPCLHGGSCTDALASYSCQCLAGYTGTNCETDIDECASSPCLHNASCVHGINSYFCLCAAGFMGNHCQTVLGTCPADFIEYQDLSRCYFIEEDSSSELTWDNAQQVCMSKNSTLASLETEEEITQVGSHFTWEGRYHIVSAKREADGRFKWNTHAELPSSHPAWAEDEPKSDKDCVAVIMRDQETKLYTLECYYARPYVCERAMLYPPGITDCSIHPCLNGATCTNITGGFQCMCRPGFTGRFCSQDVDDCASNPCQHGATCRDGFADYTCVCPPGYSGTNCETDIDECASNPCQNGATCVDGVDSFTCDCLANYTGRTCESGPNDVCPPEFEFMPIRNRCFLIKEGSSNEKSWQVAEAFCDSHGATLASLETKDEVDFVGSFFTHTGRYHIVSARRESGSTFYWNTGAILDTTHESWYSGQPSYEDCVAVIMSGGTSSLYSMGCSYERPFVCEMPMILGPGASVCLTQPCLNGAECHQLTNNTHYCNCTTGFTGANCETDIDECAASPCQNGGACLNLVGAYSCSCLTGYSGLHCEIDIDECASSPCLNDGTCIDGNASYTCSCPANHTGPNCETGPDDPCPFGFVFYPNTARCYFIQEDRDQQMTFDDATVFCANKEESSLASLETEEEVDFVGNQFTWTGRYHIVGARRNAQGSFAWTSGAILSDTFSKWSSDEPKSYQDCVSVINNSGVSKLYTLACTYARPFVCERPRRMPPGVSDCRSSPCHYGSTCMNVTGGGYQCLCRAGFTGEHCETDIDECVSVPCQNGGTCVHDWAFYTCQCPSGYTGPNCETDIDECASNPCSNGATCLDHPNSYSCLCAPGFTGSRCFSGENDTCPTDFHHDEEHARCYFLEEDSSEQKNIQDATDDCRNRGAELASLETAEEMTYVGELFTWTGRYHVVNARRASNGTFYWGSGVELPTGNNMWSSGEPGSKDCVAIIKESSGSSLYGLDCSLARPYVCESGII